MWTSRVVTNVAFCHAHPCIQYSALIVEGGEKLSHVLMEKVRTELGNLTIQIFMHNNSKQVILCLSDSQLILLHAPSSTVVL